MRKYLAAGLVGLALLAGQAAASESAVLSAGDRVGSSSATANNLVGAIPIYAWLFGAAFLAVVVWSATDNGGNPVSP